MKSLKRVEILWDDATHYRNENDIEWYRENACTTEFTTIGHLIKQNRKVIVLAHEITDEDRARDVSVIPRKLVKSIRRLG